MMEGIVKASPWDLTLRGRPIPGRVAERRRLTCFEDVERFAEMTGDRNPLHFDPAVAAASPFGGLIVQGGITSGLLNAIVAEDPPGPGSVFLGVEWRYLKAVRVGEEITGRVEVTAIREDKPIATLRTEVRNARGEVCLAGTVVTYTTLLRAAPPPPTVANPDGRRKAGLECWLDPRRGPGATAPDDVAQSARPPGSPPQSKDHAMSRLSFTEHPAQAGESYLQHFGVAVGVGTRMIAGGLACLLHGALPFLCTTTGSRTIASLHERMTAGRRGRSAVADSTAAAACHDGSVKEFSSHE